MSANSKGAGRQRGATAVEVAVLAAVFFTIVFATLEIARAIYVFNTLQEVTRRAAAELARRTPADPDSAAIVEVRRRAIFQQGGDQLVLAAPVGVGHVQVDYLSLVRDADGRMRRVPTTPAPTCAIANRRTCMANPNSPACVRFVRVRICEPGSGAACAQVPYQPAFPLVPLAMPLPRASTIATIESFGYQPGMPAYCL